MCTQRMWSWLIFNHWLNHFNRQRLRNFWSPQDIFSSTSLGLLKCLICCPSTMGAFIAKMLLPTVSSLVFLPAASVAAKRGFHMEAMVYFFTMFFTAVRDTHTLHCTDGYSCCKEFYCLALYSCSRLKHPLVKCVTPGCIGGWEDFTSG